MKSLILKDLYNIGHNIKSMLLIVVFFAFIFIPSGADGYVAVCSILCTTMIITTFSFDDLSGWDRYAMIMPVTKKELVAGKFVVPFLFSGIGCVAGLVLGTAGSVVLHKMVLSWEGISAMLLAALGGFVVSIVLGSLSLPLVFKFGTEKARMLLMVSFLLPSAIIFGIYKLIQKLGITVTEDMVRILLCLSPVIALAWVYGMYKISCTIFKKKEF